LFSVCFSNNRKSFRHSFLSLVFLLCFSIDGLNVFKVLASYFGAKYRSIRHLGSIKTRHVYSLNILKYTGYISNSTHVCPSTNVYAEESFYHDILTFNYPV
jgi:hypothetical protein